MISYWSSQTGNTQKFIEKVNLPASRINNSGEVDFLYNPYILIIPTFANHEGLGAVPKPVTKFLSSYENRRNMIGVIGGGNRNFGDMFGIGAKIVSKEYNVPLLYLFELAGMQTDVIRVREGISKYVNHHNKTRFS